MIKEEKFASKIKASALKTNKKLINMYSESSLPRIYQSSHSEPFHHTEACDPELRVIISSILIVKPEFAIQGVRFLISIHDVQAAFDTWPLASTNRTN